MKTLNDFYRLFPNRPAMVVAARPAQVQTPDKRPANEPIADAVDETTDLARRYRARDYGTGYGRSSGYAQDRSYTAGFGDRMLRVG
jgi:hypothetical protein